MKKLQLHENTNKAEILSITVVLNQQYMCTNGSEEPFKHYFALGFLVIKEFDTI
jgi:hypothetical protein